MLPEYYIHEELERQRERYEREQIRKDRHRAPAYRQWNELEESIAEEDSEASQRGVEIIQL